MGKARSMSRVMTAITIVTAAGVAGVAWPREIRIAVSEDGRLWRCDNCATHHFSGTMGDGRVNRFTSGDA